MPGLCHPDHPETLFDLDPPVNPELLASDIWADVLAVRTQRPLVHSITNLVVMNYNANFLLAMGASPVMAHAHEEVRDMAAIAQALVLNIGTLPLPSMTCWPWPVLRWRP